MTPSPVCLFPFPLTTSSGTKVAPMVTMSKRNFESCLMNLHASLSYAIETIIKWQPLPCGDSIKRMMSIVERLPSSIGGWLIDLMTERLKPVDSYELQIDQSCKGLGIGRILMDMLQALGEEWSMEKVMLTVFKSNTHARAFYQRIGFQLDEIDPSLDEEPQEVDYHLMSRPCK